MAFFIENDVIYLTKGDDAVLEVSSIIANDGSEYPLQDTDVLTLTVRALPTALVPVLIQIDSEPGDIAIVLNHEDTEALSVGKYSADVQLTTEDGKRYTIWPRLTGNLRYEAKNFSNFVVMPEVTVK